MVAVQDPRKAACLVHRVERELCVLNAVRALSRHLLLLTPGMHAGEGSIGARELPGSQNLTPLQSARSSSCALRMQL